MLRPAVLSEAEAHSELIAKPLVDAGFELQRCSMEEVAPRLRSGLFNVLVIGRFYSLRRTMQQEETILAEFQQAVRDFLARGGGVYFALPSGRVRAPGELLEEYGATIPEHLGVADSGSAFHDVFGLRNIYTEAVAEPVDQGVGGIWYPGHAEDVTPSTRPVVCSEEDGWQVVLRGSPTSCTVTSIMGHGGLGVEEGSGFDASVPLMAVRQVGRGRLAVCGIPSGFYVSSPHIFPLAENITCSGFDGKPSGLGQLFINALSWLSEPSLQSGDLGGATSDADAVEPQAPRYPDEPAVCWAERDFPPDSVPQRGLIGARTAYSTGRGTVAEYVKKARAAGLDFVVFLEDLNQLEAEGLEALKADCEAHSTDTFFAVPGYTMEDVAGNHFFQYGYLIVMPRQELLEPGTKLLAPPPPEPGATSTKQSFAMVHQHYLFGDLDFRCRRGTYRHAENGMRIHDLRFCDSIALVTWEGGCMVEDVRGDFGRLEQKGLRLNPTALTLMNGPDEMDAALASGWRTVMLEPYRTVDERLLFRFMAPELEWWGNNDERIGDGPRHRFDRWQYTWPFQYITSGPEVHAWTCSASGRDREWRGPDSEVPPVADWFRADQMGFRLRIKVTSEVGLEEVRLFDATRPVRRWQCEGAAAFEQELDLVNHQQMQLWLEAVDVEGRSALCMDYYTYRLDWCEFYCADRNNPLNIGYERDERGFAYGWSSALFLNYDVGSWGGTSRPTGPYGSDSIAPVPKNPLRDLTRPQDGGIGHSGAVLSISVQLPELPEPELGPMVHSQHELISTDVASCSFLVEDGLDPDWPYFYGLRSFGSSYFPVQPTRYLRLHRRGTVFRPRPHALTTVLYEYELGMKKETGITDRLSVGSLSLEAQNVFHMSDGRRIELDGGPESPPELTWHAGEAVVSWTDGCRPAIFINDGVDMQLGRSAGPGSGYGLFLAQPHLPTPRRPIRLRVIGVGGTSEDTSPDTYDRMAEAMGLKGDPAYHIDLQAGRLLSTRLFLDLDGEGDGVAFGLPRADLPMALPLRVHGLNPNWSTFLVDRSARRWRPMGVLDGTAYATLDTLAGDWSVFIGHPVSASDPDIVLSLAQIADAEWMLEVHNPTSEARDVDVQVSRYFDLLAWEGEQVALGAGESRYLRLRGR